MIQAAGYVLDTNVVSETRRPQPHAGVVEFLGLVNPDLLFLSVLTMGELRKGIAMRRPVDPVFADRLSLWADDLEAKFADRLLPIDAATAALWGDLSAHRALPVIDTLIAATALRHGYALVTRNERDVAPTGVPLVNPWKSPSRGARRARPGRDVPAS